MAWQNCRIEHGPFHGHDIAILHLPSRAPPAFVEVRPDAAKQPAAKEKICTGIRPVFVFHKVKYRLRRLMHKNNSPMLFF
jgi:hypothetical protein